MIHRLAPRRFQSLPNHVKAPTAAWLVETSGHPLDRIVLVEWDPATVTLTTYVRPDGPGEAVPHATGPHEPPPWLGWWSPS
jgi:hypothetical protein